MKKTLALTLVAGLAFGSTALAQGTDRAQSKHERGAKLLARLDQNADGKLSRQELQAQALKRFEAADSDNDGKVTQAELSRHVAAKMAERQAKRAERMKALDSNGDGQWSKDELSKLPERWFSKLDQDQDGVLSRQELEARKFGKANFWQRLPERASFKSCARFQMVRSEATAATRSGALIGGGWVGRKAIT